MSSTMRRRTYDDELQAAIADGQAERGERAAERKGREERDALAADVAALQAFDQQREQQEEEDKRGKRRALSKSAYVRRLSAMTAATVALF